MTNENKMALIQANNMSIAIAAFLDNGNSEMAHRATGVYNSILLTILLTELVPGAQKELDKMKEVPNILPDGTPVQ